MTRVFDALMPAFAAMLVIDLFVTLVGEFGVPHGSEVAARASHEIEGGRYSSHFWLGSITVGHVLPLVLLGVVAATNLGFYTTAGIVLVASLATLIGLYLYEHAYVMAPQEVPNS